MAGTMHGEGQPPTHTHTLIMEEINCVKYSVNNEKYTAGKIVVGSSWRTSRENIHWLDEIKLSRIPFNLI